MVLGVEDPPRQSLVLYYDKRRLTKAAAKSMPKRRVGVVVWAQRDGTREVGPLFDDRLLDGRELTSRGTGIDVYGDIRS